MANQALSTETGDGAPWSSARTVRRARALRLLRRDPVTLVALCLLALTVIVAVFAPAIAPANPAKIDPFNGLKAPSQAHLLGTDENGRDEFSRVIFGTREALKVSTFSVALAAAVGIAIGLVAGYQGGFVDGLAMRFMDALLAFPALILALTIVAILGRGTTQVILAIAITSIPGYARIVRAMVLSLKSRDYVLAAHATGAGGPRIIVFHILPNTWSVIIVQASLGMAFAILAEAGLSFLGLGAQPPIATWGSMLQKALPLLHDAPYLAIFPGLAITLLTLALNIMGDALRDWLDPRLRGRA